MPVLGGGIKEICVTVAELWGSSSDRQSCVTSSPSTLQVQGSAWESKTEPEQKQWGGTAANWAANGVKEGAWSAAPSQGFLAAQEQGGDVQPCPLSPQLHWFWPLVTVTVPWCAQGGGDPVWEGGMGSSPGWWGSGGSSGGLWVLLTPSWPGGLRGGSVPRPCPVAVPGALCPDSCPRVLSRLLPSFVILRLPPLVYVRVPFLRLSEISFSLCGQETDFNCLYFLPPFFFFFF